RAEEGSRAWDAFIGDVGAMAMGATTYEWVLDHEQLSENPQRWQEFYDDRPCWVFTHRDLPAPPGVDIRFVRDDVAPVHREMVAAAGERNVWIVGGGEPLLPRRIEGMRLVDVRPDGQMVSLTYDVRG